MNRRTRYAVCLLAVLTLASAGCDFSPSSPFAGFEEEQQQGATLHGEFQQSGVAVGSQQSVAAGYNAQRTLATASNTELTATAVIVYDANGSELGSVDIDADGSFTLRGLPEYFTLVFVDANGDAVGEPMEFDGVKPNQEIDIVVAMVDGEVVLLEESRTGIDHEGASGIEIDGAAQNIVIDSDPMTGSLYVNEYHVLTRAGETSIRKGNRSLTLKHLEEGDQVHVRGVFEGEDVFAFEIKLQEEEEKEDDVAPQSACSSWDPKKPGKILVCHKGKKTLSISPNAWPGHYGHGDTCGPC